MSQKNLKIDQIHGLLVHRALDLSTPNGDVIWNTILELRNENRVCNVGISIYSDFPLNPLLSKFEPNIIQLPINVFDQRAITNGILTALQSYDIEIHARSIFLQGMLIEKSENIPTWLKQARKSVENFQHRMSLIGVSPLEATIAFLKSLNCFKVSIVGVKNKRELEDILLAGRVTVPHFQWHELAQTDSSLLDPRNWGELLKLQQNR